MNKIKLLIVSIGVSGVLFLLPVLGFGQAALEPSYEVSLQLLMGSNDGGQKGNLPSTLSGISQRLKSSYSYSNYRLAETLLGRISNRGKFEYKSGANFGRDLASQPPNFIEMTLNELKTGQTAKGSQAFQIETFRFGARVPVITSVIKDESGKERSAVNYEQIGLTLNKVGLSENVPTLIGTLNMPGVNDTIFLVMTIKPVDL
ncbi:MAG TPA: hypothetical protein PLP21_02355 [Pyrinomonadaceae bacterium]|nr:hypothetical protein [Acidobacteriota bacterium]HQZ95127.1 hypothetical protein [Pyrinomonadaceae bacterium]